MGLFKKIFIGIQRIEITLLYAALIVSLAALGIYLLDLNLSDKALFFLLKVLRYSAFVLCVCALYRLLVNIYHTIRRPSVLRAIKNLLYLVFILYGAVIIFFEVFVSVVTHGNA